MRDLKLNISYKLTLVVALFLLPLSVMSWIVVGNYGASSRFTELEREGIRYQAPLRAVVANLPVYLGSVPSTDEARKSAELALNAAFAELDRASVKYGKDLQFTERGLNLRGRIGILPATVNADWVQLRQSADDLPEFRKRGFALLDKAFTMITHSGDTSNLILDPDLDSYYLMDVMLLALPQTLSRSELASRDALLPDYAPANPKPYPVLAAFFSESDADRVAASAKTSLNEDQNFYGVSPSLRGRLVPALSDYSLKADALKNALAAASGPGAAGTAAIVPALFAYRDSSLRLWELSAQELDALLGLRLLSITRNEIVSLSLSLLSAALAVILAIVVSRSILISGARHERPYPHRERAGFYQAHARGLP
jgi:hypothetical protein